MQPMQEDGHGPSTSTAVAALRRKRAAPGEDGEGDDGGAADPGPGPTTGPDYWQARRDAWRALGEAKRREANVEGGGGAGGGGGGGGGSAGPPPHRRPVIDADATYESLLMTDVPFKEPIPLDEMVDFLVDVWVEDGLY